MEAQDSQQPQLILANKLFLLTHPDVADIEKVRLRQEVLDSVVADDMAPLYESLAANAVLELDQSVLASMRSKIDDQLKKLDENKMEDGILYWSMNGSVYSLHILWLAYLLNPGCHCCV